MAITNGPVNGNGNGHTRMHESYVKEFLYVVFKRKRFIAGVLLVVMGGVALGAMLSSQTYVASATLLLKRERGELLVSPTQSAGGNVNLRVNLDQDLNSEVELLQRRTLLTDVVKTIGAPAVLAGRLPGVPEGSESPSAMKVYAQQFVGFVRPALAAPGKVAGLFSPDTAIPEEDRAIATFDKTLLVTPVPNSNLIKVSFVAPDPRLASAVVGNLVKGYLEQYSKIRSSPGTVDFFQTQVKSLAKDLKDAEDQLREFDIREGVTVLTRQRELYLQTAVEQETALQNAKTMADELKEKTQVLRTQLATLPDRIVTSEEMRKNPINDTMAQRLLELEIERNKMLQKYTDQDRRVTDVEKEITLLKDKYLASETWEFARKTFGENPARNPFIIDLVNTEAERIRAEVRAKNLARTTADYYSRLRHADAMVIERTRQERKIKTLEDAYLLYTKKAEEARISGALDENRIVNVALAEPVVVAPQPGVAGGRSVGTLFVLGAIVGLVGGVGGAFCREYLSQAFTTEASVGRELDLPVVASIKDERK